MAENHPLFNEKIFVKKMWGKMSLFVDKKPNWITCISDAELRDAAIQEIISFYLIHTPVEELSSMSIPLSEYGWLKPWRKPVYLNKQLKAAASTYELLFSADTYDKLGDAINESEEASDFPTSLDIEYIVFYDCKKNQFISVFYHIRNALAHGRFRICNDSDGNRVVVMEDVVKMSNNSTCKLSARMVIRVNTLLAWISIIKAGEKKYIRRVW